MIELGYGDVKSFVIEVEQSEDIDICQMMAMNNEEVKEQRTKS